MLIERVEFIDYERDGTGVIVCSGSGIGMGLMDVLTECRYLIDLDTYRTDKTIDWECIAVILSLRVKPSVVVMAGWFTIDEPLAFNRFERGVLVPKFVYRGGGVESLSDFINRIRIRKY